MSDHLAPPVPNFVNPAHVVPLSPPPRPPFQTYLSSTSLPATPHTPYVAPLPSANPPADGRTPLQPFLGLGPRLLLTTLSPALLPLILTIAHLIQTRSSTAQLAQSLRASLLSACAGLATGAASLQALPRYLAMQTNDEVVRATQASILAIGAALMDTVTIMETVLTFIVDCYRSMLLCTIQLAVQGTLDILIGAVELITSSVTSTLNGIRDDIQAVITEGNSVIQDAVKAINSVTELVDVTLAVPNVTVPQLAWLDNVTVPTTFEDTLLKLNASMPTLDALKSKMDALIDTPFELLKADINATRLALAASFNASALPVPSLVSLAAASPGAGTLQHELCGDLDTSLIDDTARALHKLGSVAIGLLFVVLVLVWAALACWEWRRWRAVQGCVELVQDEWDRGGARDPWTVVAIVENPMLEKYAGPLMGRVATTPRARTNFRWFLSYLGHPTMLTLLFIAGIGLVALECQLAALDAIRHRAASTANATVTASTDSLVARLNTLSANASQGYADEFNAAVAGIQGRIDGELFGGWVNTTATTLNTTLVEFYAEVESLLNDTFGGTILYSPVNTFIYCVLGSKITNLEKGLSWLADHSQVDLPSLPANVLQLSNASMNELVAPVTAAAVGAGSGTGGDDDDGVVGELINHYESALQVERTVYAVLLGLYLALFLVGAAIAVWHSGGRERYVALHERVLAMRGLPSRRDRDGFVDDDTGGGGGMTTGGPRSWPWKKQTPIYDAYADDKRRPGPVPLIVEPMSGSFLRYSAGPGRLTSTLSALAAPGQAFLRMTGYHSDVGDHHGVGVAGERSAPLVQPGTSSEKYTRHGGGGDDYALRRTGTGAIVLDDGGDARGHRDDLATPPPIWVHRFYGAVDQVRGFVRARAHGAALARKPSTRTEQSFGASQAAATARTPGMDWAGDGRGASVRSMTPTPRRAGDDAAGMAWSMAPSPTVGRQMERAQSSVPVSLSSYPRRLSRAPTIANGAYELPPAVPSKGSAADTSRPVDPFTTPMRRATHDPFETDERPDSVDYLVDDADVPYDLGDFTFSAYAPGSAGGGHGDVASAARHNDHGDNDVERVDSPGSGSSTAGSRSYVWSVGSEPRVESAKTGTAALAAIFAGMDRRKREAEGVRRSRIASDVDEHANPFEAH